MRVLQQVQVLLQLTHSHGIVRRYFVVNGFDGALTILGMITGFHVSGEDNLNVIISTCFGAAVALTASGLASAYISEAAEKRKDFSDLQEAMVADLSDTHHARAAKIVPFLVAAVNGLAPFVFSLLIITPLWLAKAHLLVSVNPLVAAMFVALTMIFLLGVFLGRVSGVFWLWSGIRTLIVAVLTMLVILAFSV
jgi:predicted membrane protein (TIGR00267 family)